MENSVRVIIEVTRDDGVERKEYNGHGVVAAVLDDEGFNTIILGSLSSAETCQAYLGLGSGIDKAFREDRVLYEEDEEC